MYDIAIVTSNGACEKITDLHPLAISYPVKDETSAQLNELQAIMLAIGAWASNWSMCTFYTLMGHCQWSGCFSQPMATTIHCPRLPPLG